MDLDNKIQGIIVLGIIVILCVGGHFALQLPDEEEEDEPEDVESEMLEGLPAYDAEPVSNIAPSFGIPDAAPVAQLCR